jgi:mRNA degradation ribonuclease J1/J2
MQEREQLANDGFVVVVVARDPQGALVAPPCIVTRGFVFQPEAGLLLDGIRAQVEMVVEAYSTAPRPDLENALRRALEDYFYRQTRRRPIVVPMLCPDNVMQS